MVSSPDMVSRVPMVSGPDMVSGLNGLGSWVPVVSVTMGLYSRSDIVHDVQKPVIPLIPIKELLLLLLSLLLLLLLFLCSSCTVDIAVTRDGEYITINSNSHTSSEVCHSLTPSSIASSPQLYSL